MELPEPLGSEPEFRRPMIVVQGDELNRSRIHTVICVPLTSNRQWASGLGNVQLAASETGLPRDSVANVSQIVAIDRSRLAERVGALSGQRLYEILQGVDLVLGR